VKRQYGALIKIVNLGDKDYWHSLKPKKKAGLRRPE
jgi:hypothetical protein